MTLSWGQKFAPRHLDRLILKVGVDHTKIGSLGKYSLQISQRSGATIFFIKVGADLIKASDVELGPRIRTATSRSARITATRIERAKKDWRFISKMLGFETRDLAREK
eukprot:TRINITY_DN3364_c0_g2_i4.p1 TRINITY_DN3364_c0_g2~~TRINITY_DN3364_c0_g2_i4.p1  ORF type:complete len:108 (+),score=0.81 TRINITY_DN3364_c0_g2_i4:615-938(+)